MMPEFARPVALDRIGAVPFETRITASVSECTAVAARLQIPAVAALECRFVLRRGADRARGEVVAEGSLHAEVVRTCVVSGDDFPAAVAQQFRIRFVRAGTETEEIDVEADDELPYDGGSVDLGETAVEQLALELDPWPRKPDVAMPPDALAPPESPFAALASRRQKH